MDTSNVTFKQSGQQNRKPQLQQGNHGNPGLAQHAFSLGAYLTSRGLAI